MRYYITALFEWMRKEDRWPMGFSMIVTDLGMRLAINKYSG